MKKTNVFFFASIFMLAISCNSGTLTEAESNHFTSADKPLTWEEQIEYAKNKSIARTRTNPDGISLKGHTHYGTINSESEIHRLMEQLFSEQTPIVINGDQKNFEIVPIGTIMQMGRESGLEDPFEFLKCQLDTTIRVGMELIELEWKYKNKIYYSTAIASNDHGGIIYDHIGHMIYDECSYSQKKEEELGLPIVKTRSENYKESRIDFHEYDFRDNSFGIRLWMYNIYCYSHFNSQGILYNREMAAHRDSAIGWSCEAKIRTVSGDLDVSNSMNLHGPMHTVRPHQSQ